MRRPIDEGGPYTILFAYDSVIFAHAVATITHDIEEEMRKEGHTFSFNVKNLTIPTKAVRLEELPLGNRAKKHRSLIKLNDNIMASYFTQVTGQT